MKNNYDIYTKILICLILILLFYTYTYIFIYNDQEKYNSFEEMLSCYVIFIIIISKYQFNIALCIFVISIFYILYIIYDDNKKNNQYNYQYNNKKNNQYNYQYNNKKNNKYNYQYNYQYNNQYNNKKNNQYNNQYNNKKFNNTYQFNYDPNVKLNREDIINLDKLIDSDKTDIQKCSLGFGIDKMNDLKIKKKICRPLLKKYHADKINKDISNEEQRNKISTQFNNCCY
jgi:hypothetical protein